MKKKVITDNSSEVLTVKWDGVRFALIHQKKSNDLNSAVNIIILNPKEMLDIIKFAGNLGEGENGQTNIE